MARIQRRIRGDVVDAATMEVLFSDVAILQLDAGLVIVGTAAAYPDHPPLPRRPRNFRVVAQVTGARLTAGDSADHETYRDADGHPFAVRVRTRKAFCCGSKYRDLPAGY